MNAEIVIICLLFSFAFVVTVDARGERFRGGRRAADDLINNDNNNIGGFSFNLGGMDMDYISLLGKKTSSTAELNLSDDECLICDKGFKQRINSIKFRYNPDGEDSKYMGTKATCTGDRDYPEETEITIGRSGEFELERGTEFIVTPNMFTGADTVIQFDDGFRCSMHTSCSVPIVTGDQIGPFIIVSGVGNAFDCEENTPPPTPEPTRYPTPKPTRQPTRLPTREPTRPPTPEPTRRPATEPCGDEDTCPEEPPNNGESCCNEGNQCIYNSCLLPPDDGSPPVQEEVCTCGVDRNTGIGRPGEITCQRVDCIQPLNPTPGPTPQPTPNPTPDPTPQPTLRPTPLSAQLTSGPSDDLCVLTDFWDFEGDKKDTLDWTEDPRVGDVEGFSKFLGQYGQSDQGNFPFREFDFSNFTPGPVEFGFDIYETMKFEENSRDGPDTVGLRFNDNNGNAVLVDFGGLDNRPISLTTTEGFRWSKTPSEENARGQQRHHFDITIPQSFIEVSPRFTITFTWNLIGSNNDFLGFDNIGSRICPPVCIPEPDPAPCCAEEKPEEGSNCFTNQTMSSGVICVYEQIVVRPNVFRQSSLFRQTTFNLTFECVCVDGKIICTNPPCDSVGTCAEEPNEGEQCCNEGGECIYDSCAPSDGSEPPDRQINCVCGVNPALGTGTPGIVSCQEIQCIRILSPPPSSCSEECSDEPNEGDVCCDEYPNCEYFTCSVPFPNGTFPVSEVCECVEGVVACNSLECPTPTPTTETPTAETSPPSSCSEECSDEPNEGEVCCDEYPNCEYFACSVPFPNGTFPVSEVCECVEGVVACNSLECPTPTPTETPTTPPPTPQPTSKTKTKTPTTPPPTLPPTPQPTSKTKTKTPTTPTPTPKPTPKYPVKQPTKSKCVKNSGIGGSVSGGVNGVSYGGCYTGNAGPTGVSVSIGGFVSGGVQIPAPEPKPPPRPVPGPAPPAPTGTTNFGQPSLSLIGGFFGS